MTIKEKIIKRIIAMDDKALLGTIYKLIETETVGEAITKERKAAPKKKRSKRKKATTVKVFDINKVSLN